MPHRLYAVNYSHSPSQQPPSAKSILSFQRMIADVLGILGPRDVLVAREYRGPHETLRTASDSLFHRTVYCTLDSWVPIRVCPVWAICLPKCILGHRFSHPPKLLKALPILLTPVPGEDRCEVGALIVGRQAVRVEGNVARRGLAAGRGLDQRWAGARLARDDTRRLFGDIGRLAR